MHSRCYNPNTRSYPRYGGRGITICEQWRTSFVAFLEDMGPCPKGYSIERIDNDGPYDAKNCQWASPIAQANNVSRNHRITWDGMTLSLAEWARRRHITASALKIRLRAGWSIDTALTRPMRHTVRNPTKSP